MTRALEITDFELHQCDELVRLWRASFEHGVGIIDPHPLAEQAAYLHEQVLPKHRLRVALQDGALVGFVASNAESVAQLHVRVDRIGQGIGSALLDLAKQASTGRLWLYTFARNVRACAFYERRAFVAVARGFEPQWQLDDVRYEWREGAAP